MRRLFIVVILQIAVLAGFSQNLDASFGIALFPDNETFLSIERDEKGYYFFVQRYIEDRDVVRDYQTKYPVKFPFIEGVDNARYVNNFTISPDGNKICVVESTDSGVAKRIFIYDFNKLENIKTIEVDDILYPYNRQMDFVGFNNNGTVLYFGSILAGFKYSIEKNNLQKLYGFNDDDYHRIVFYDPNGDVMYLQKMSIRERGSGNIHYVDFHKEYEALTLQCQKSKEILELPSFHSYRKCYNNKEMEKLENKGFKIKGKLYNGERSGEIRTYINNNMTKGISYKTAGFNWKGEIRKAKVETIKIK